MVRQPDRSYVPTAICSLITGPDIKPCLKNRPFEIRTNYCDPNTGLVRYFDIHCIINKENLKVFNGLTCDKSIPDFHQTGRYVYNHSKSFFKDVFIKQVFLLLWNFSQNAVFRIIKRN
jgi:hypothetical protein